MEFLEGSRGIYRPIRVLFDTNIYDRALQLCWHTKSYKSQIALVMELLRLQQKNQIPPPVTAEDMIIYLMEQSKSTLRERLWEFELEDFDEDEAKPLLKLVWAVNVSNKMRDVEFEARRLLNSPEALPPNFQHPKVLSLAQDYAKILREKQQEAPSSKLLCPQEVVLEVVPRVLQGFWVLPPGPLLNMPSQQLSKMSVGVTKAVMDQVSNALTSGYQTTFSRSMRDDMVLSVLTKIRQTYPHDVLVNRINCFAPVLLSKIVDVAVGQICGMFQPQSPKVLAHLTPGVEPPATTPLQHNFNLAEEQPTPCPETAPLTSPAEPESITNVQAREDVKEKASLEKDPEPTREPDSAVAPAPLTPPAEPPSIKVQAREDVKENSRLEKDPEPTTETDSAEVPAFQAPLTSPPEPVVITAVQDGLTTCLAETEQPTFSPAVALPPAACQTSSTEPFVITDVQDREDTNENSEPTREPDSATVPADPPSIKVQSREVGNEKPSLEKYPEPTREPDSSAVPASSAPLEPVVIVTLPSEVEITKEKRSPGFFRWLFQPLCCCFMDSDTY